MFNRLLVPGSFLICAVVAGYLGAGSFLFESNRGVDVFTLYEPGKEPYEIDLKPHAWKWVNGGRCIEYTVGHGDNEVHCGVVKKRYWSN